MRHSLFFCSLMLCAGAAFAQQVQPTAAKPVAEKPAAVAARQGKPPGGYQKFNPNEPLTDWRTANNTVRDIGGWRAYAREAAANAKQGAAK